MMKYTTVSGDTIYISLWTNYNLNTIPFGIDLMFIYISLWTNYNGELYSYASATSEFTFHYELIITPYKIHTIMQLIYLHFTMN